ncbi:MAG: 50S ribosomal protein L30 [Pseudomonadota bacterium]|nr:50S ribosomal protein L30 [Pseudomonadota bacterium]
MPQDKQSNKDTHDQIAVMQRRSLIGQPLRMRRLVRSLGLRRINHRVIKKDNNCTRGMINKAIHLLAYELLPAGAESKTTTGKTQ